MIIIIIIIIIITKAKVQRRTLMLAWQSPSGQPWGKRARVLVCPAFLSCPAAKKRTTVIVIFFLWTLAIFYSIKKAY